MISHRSVQRTNHFSIDIDVSRVMVLMPGSRVLGKSYCGVAVAQLRDLI